MKNMLPNLQLHSACFAAQFLCRLFFPDVRWSLLPPEKQEIALKKRRRKQEEKKPAPTSRPSASSCGRDFDLGKSEWDMSQRLDSN